MNKTLLLKFSKMLTYYVYHITHSEADITIISHDYQLTPGRVISREPPLFSTEQVKPAWTYCFCVTSLLGLSQFHLVMFLND